MLSRTLSRFVSKASTKPAISVAITKQVAEMATAPQEPTVSDLLQRKSQRSTFVCACLCGEDLKGSSLLPQPLIDWDELFELWWHIST